jgi:ABC-type sugar transport system permease subunit
MSIGCQRKTLTAWFFVAPAVAILLFSVVYPILWSLLASFRSINAGDLYALRLWRIPGQWTAANYQRLLHSDIFRQSLVNTAYFAVLYIPGTMAIAMVLALLVRKGIRGLGIFRALFFLSYVISIVAAGMVWRWMFNTEHGLVNAIIASMISEKPDWFGNPHLAMLVIVLMCVWRWSGYFMLIFLAGLESIPRELYDAAAVDGADGWQRFWKITLPLMRRPIFFALIVLLIRAQNIFQEVYVMTDGGPDNGTITVAYRIWQAGISHGEIGRGAAMSYLLFLAVLLVAVAQFLLLGRERKA